MPDGIWLTLSERKSGFPAHLVIISETGYGPRLCIDVSRTDEERENPVVMVGPGGDMENAYRDAMKGNSTWTWLRSKFFPRRTD